QGEVYSDFVLLWLICHQSRVETEIPAECWLERWSHTAQEQGARALEKLRDGVEEAIKALGCGFLSWTTTIRRAHNAGFLSADSSAGISAPLSVRRRRPEFAPTANSHGGSGQPIQPVLLHCTPANLGPEPAGDQALRRVSESAAGDAEAWRRLGVPGLGPAS